MALRSSFKLLGLVSVFSLVAAAVVAVAATPATAKRPEVPALGTVQFDAADYTAGEAAGAVSIAVERTNWAGSAKVLLTVIQGSATDGIDYRPLRRTSYSRWVEFETRETRRVMEIALVDDSRFEGPEAFSVSLSDPSAGLTVGSPAQAGVTILDDESATVSIADQLPVGEGELAEFPMTVSVLPGVVRDVAVTVDWALAFGTATAGDFTGPTSGSISIPASTSDAVISVATADDLAYEVANETFRVDLSNPSPGVTIGTGSASGSIDDDDGYGLTCPADDTYEPNNSPDGAAHIRWAGTIRAILCPGDGDENGRLSDFYRLDAFAGRTIDVEATFAHAEGDINLTLWDPEGTVVTWSNGTSDAEHLTYQVPLGAAGAYAVQGYMSLDSGSAPGNVYSLKVGGDTCPADDPAEDDDEAATARLLTPESFLEGVLCPDDSDPNGRISDFYAVDALEGQTLDLRANFLHAEGNINLWLWDPAGSLVTFAAGTADGETISYLVPSGGGGRYHLQVSLVADGGDASGNAYAVIAFITGGGEGDSGGEEG